VLRPCGLYYFFELREGIEAALVNCKQLWGSLSQSFQFWGSFCAVEVNESGKYQLHAAELTKAGVTFASFSLDIQIIMLDQKGQLLSASSQLLVGGTRVGRGAFLCSCVPLPTTGDLISHHLKRRTQGRCDSSLFFSGSDPQ
jgi:hypothetical protein